MRVLMLKTVTGTCEGQWLIEGHTIALSDEAGQRLIDSGEAIPVTVAEEKPARKKKAKP